MIEAQLAPAVKRQWQQHHQKQQRKFEVAGIVGGDSIAVP